MEMSETKKLISQDQSFLDLVYSSFTTENQRLFVESFKQYLDYDEDDFAVDLDNIWQWIGLSKKGNAKKILINNFKEGYDFIVNSINFDEKPASSNGEAGFSSVPQIPSLINNGNNPSDTLMPSLKNQGGHGLNREIIKMNLRTFRKFCMLAKTEKGNQIRDYFASLESIVIKYSKNILEKSNKEIKDAKLKENLLLEDIKKVQEKSKWERHRTMLDTHTNKNLIYLIHLFDLEDGRFVIKLGKTNDLRGRIQRINHEYSVKARILDVILSEKNYEFEQHLHNHQKFISIRYKKLINGKKTYECYLINGEKQYDEIKHFVHIEKQHYYSYNKEELQARAEIEKAKADIIKNEVEIKKMDILKLAIEQKMPIDQIKELLKTLEENNNQTLKERIEPENNLQTQENEPTSSLTTIPQEQTTNNDTDNNTRIPIGRQVQAYLPEDLAIVARVFNGLFEAQREVPGTTISEIKKYASTKRILAGYRWYLIDRNDKEPWRARDIGQTVEHTIKEKRFIAKLNLDRTKVLNVFSKQKDVAQAVGEGTSTISNAVKYGNCVKGYFYAPWDTLSETIQKQFLLHNSLPNERRVERGICIEKLDEDKNVIESFRSAIQVQLKYNITAKTLHKYTTNGEMYKGFYWRKT